MGQRSISVPLRFIGLEVPGHPGCGFDSYGPSQTLNASYIATAVRQDRSAAFYPSTLLSAETGMLRGCVITRKDAELDEMLDATPLLRRAASDATAEAV